jgi:hypothetical protein
MRLMGSNELCFSLHVSMTIVQSGIVILVSATEIESIESLAEARKSKSQP